MPVGGPLRKVEISHELIILSWSAIPHIKKKYLLYDMEEESLNPNFNFFEYIFLNIISHLFL